MGFSEAGRILWGMDSETYEDLRARLEIEHRLRQAKDRIREIEQATRTRALVLMGQGMASEDAEVQAAREVTEQLVADLAAGKASGT